MSRLQSLGNIDRLLWLFIFWSSMLVFSNYFMVGITDATIDNVLFDNIYVDRNNEINDNMNIYETGGSEGNVLETLLTGLSKVPLLKYTVPLANIMLFRITAGSIPFALGILLNLVMVITILTLYDFFIRPLMGGS